MEKFLNSHPNYYKKYYANNKKKYAERNHKSYSKKKSFYYAIEIKGQTYYFQKKQDISIKRITQDDIKKSPNFIQVT